MRKEAAQWRNRSRTNNLSGNRPREWQSHELLDLSTRLNQMLDAAFPDGLMPNHFGAMQDQVNTLPIADIDETETHYLVTLEAPGVARADLSIEVDNDELVIRAERKFRSDGSTSRAVRHMVRSFTLPPGAETEHIQANLRDGVLELAIPKTESGEAKRIEVGENQDGLFTRFMHRVSDAITGGDLEKHIQDEITKVEVKKDGNLGARI